MYLRPIVLFHSIVDILKHSHDILKSNGIIEYHLKIQLERIELMPQNLKAYLRLTKFR